MNELFNQRKSVRSFKADPIEKKELKEILEAANSAPSAGNLKARKIIIVAEKEKKEELAKAAYDQEFIAEAPVAIVFVALPKVSSHKYGEKGEKLYSIQDATIAASFAWLQTVDLGLAACWVGGFDEKNLQQSLGLAENEKPVVILPIGHST
ncbi:MAG: nitroreductase family protein [Parcubacteria group bacterium]|jgi:nitroreductase